MPAAAPDGRHRRSQVTRAALAEAYLELLESGEMSPTVEQIAARAGVSSRAVFRHYRDREGFLASVTDRQVERLSAWAPPPPRADAPRGRRVAGFVRRWAAVHERVTHVRRAALQDEFRSPVIAQRMAWAHALLVREAGVVFAAELGRMAEQVAERRVAVLASLVSFNTWDQLRRYRGFGPEAAEAALVEAIEGLLGPSPSA